MSQSGTSNTREEKNGRRTGYWARRKDAVYLAAAKQICHGYCAEPTSVIDVGSNKTPTLEWHRSPKTRLVSVDLKRPYEAEGVESIVANFLEFPTEEKFDLVTCFQVIEHVPAVHEFVQKLLSVGGILVVSVPYKWPRGQCIDHVHDPIDEKKMLSWFGRAPTYSYIAREPITAVARLIQVYAPPGTPSPPRLKVPKKSKNGAARRSRSSLIWRAKNWLRRRLS